MSQLPSLADIRNVDGMDMQAFFPVVFAGFMIIYTYALIFENKIDLILQHRYAPDISYYRDEQTS